MSHRTLLSRLLKLSKPTNNNPFEGLAGNKYRRWFGYLIQLFIIIALLLSAIWLLLAVWYQFGLSSMVTWLVTGVVLGLLTLIVVLRYWPKIADKLTNKTLKTKKLSRWLTALYGSIWLVSLGWFFSIEAQNQRDWQPEVSQVFSYTRDASNPDLITLHNVRNFDWYLAEEAIDDDKASDKDNDALEVVANERWQTRTIDMSKLSGIDVTNSYWMGPLIAHTLVSFRFENDKPVSFSFEIRKEQNESFSALAGFFRRFELILIASEERDIIYTRSNARGEQVYLFPISHLQQHEVRALFESYLSAADDLDAKPAWYNTFTSNCTNIIFYMARIVSGDRLPWDYRIWVSGWLPNYLYDIGMLDANITDVSAEANTQLWSMDMWYERTHINPKVKGFDNLQGFGDKSAADIEDNGRKFSTQIRQGLPMPPLADSLLEAESKAESAASVSNP